MKSQGVAISMVYPIMKTLVHKGYNTEQFCQFAAFDASLLRDVEARISGEELERITIAAAQFTQDEHFGLHQGQMMEFSDMGILGYVMMHSASVLEALTAYQRYNVLLCSGFNLDWNMHDDHVEIAMFLQHPEEGTMSRHCIEDMASSLYRLISRLSNQRIPLLHVSFSHDAPSDVTPYESILGRIPQFGASENKLRFPKDVLSYPVLYSDAKLLTVFENIAQETRQKLTETSRFTDQVVQWMHACQPSYFPTVQQTADYFQMSSRTLQHKLKEERTTYNEISTQLRKELAMGYLRKWEYSVGEIAYVLHFSEPSAFQNAFKKWTGVTPGQYRANL
ncbi:AraC family transcriptional regulator [Paenibacillus qinlingensis]|uniref:AraC-like DNA-binding protein n=1 Tax=Paenibacillus qinlingensis TaxID=1837343 RepID=A0ABU1NN28_9BACL|nr:AraC family transcriptional regulator [Paenibacillus qinlingensis]MDR6548832.1 AraC-like DNA-binding protein [Paenibacillus qinlingensis]